MQNLFVQSACRFTLIRHYVHKSTFIIHECHQSPTSTNVSTSPLLEPLAIHGSPFSPQILSLGPPLSVWGSNPLSHIGLPPCPGKYGCFTILVILITLLQVMTELSFYSLDISGNVVYTEPQAPISQNEITVIHEYLSVLHPQLDHFQFSKIIIQLLIILTALGI